MITWRLIPAPRHRNSVENCYDMKWQFNSFCTKLFPKKLQNHDWRGDWSSSRHSRLQKSSSWRWMKNLQREFTKLKASNSQDLRRNISLLWIELALSLLTDFGDEVCWWQVLVVSYRLDLKIWSLSCQNCHQRRVDGITLSQTLPNQNRNYNFINFHWLFRNFQLDICVGGKALVVVTNNFADTLIEVHADDSMLVKGLSPNYLLPLKFKLPHWMTS